MGQEVKFYSAKKYKWTVYPLTFIKEMIERRRDNEKDNVILVTGGRGDGKSTFVGKVLFLFQDFDPYESMVYTKEAFFKQLKKKRNYLWGDEGIVNAAKGNVMTKANKLLFEGMTINRDNFNTIFIVIPSVEDFDTKILQYCSAWIHIVKRGLAAMFIPQDKGLFGKKTWDIDAMKRIFDDFQKENKQGYNMPFWVYNTFVGYIKFGKLKIEQEEIVKEIKSLRKNENLDKLTQEEVVTQVKELDNYNKYSSKKLAEAIAKGEIRSIEQFNLNCQDLKLSPEDMMKKCDAIFKRSNLRTTKGFFRDYKKEDNLIKF